nr:ubiquitin carboxyl-terminal hydrolase 9-like [Tanacetum cinerariifolium]
MEDLDYLLFHCLLGGLDLLGLGARAQTLVRGAKDSKISRLYPGIDEHKWMEKVATNHGYTDALGTMGYGSIYATHTCSPYEEIRILKSGYPHGFSVKLNCDAALKCSKADFGIVVRDSTGYLRYVLGKLCHAISPLNAEIIAVHYACSLASDRGWFNVTVESDSHLAISLACSEATPPWNLAALVDDIRLWANNMELSFSWVNRECNQVAHWVAPHAFSTTSSSSWDVYFPQELTSLARSDLHLEENNTNLLDITGLDQLEQQLNSLLQQVKIKKELLTFLLDGLHEDLKRVKQKPYFKTKDSDDHPNNEFWSYHKARNDSIVVDVCHSEMEAVCQCHLLLMSQNMVASRIKDLYQALDTTCYVGSDETLVLAEEILAYDHQIYRYLDGGDSFHSTKDDECIVAYRLSKKQAKFCKLEICHRFLEKLNPGERKIFDTLGYLFRGGARIMIRLKIMKIMLRLEMMFSWSLDGG